MFGHFNQPRSLPPNVASYMWNYPDVCCSGGGGEIHDCATSMYSIIRDSRIFEDDQKLRKALRVTDRVKYDACWHLLIVSRSSIPWVIGKSVLQNISQRHVPFGTQTWQEKKSRSGTVFLADQRIWEHSGWARFFRNDSWKQMSSSGDEAW